jgi:uncharacterized protein
MASTGTERFTTLDATRGIAVMGILLINIISFSMPEAAYVNPRAWGGTGPVDLAAWTINQLFFEGRMRGLFALLFGASAMLVMARAADAGANPVTTHLRRMAVLALFGAAHCYLIWDGDILLHYAILGCVIWLVRDWPVKALVQAAIIVLAMHTLWWGWQMGGALYFQSVATAPGAAPRIVAEYQAMLRSFPGPDTPAIARHLAVYRGDYASIVEYRTTHGLFTPWSLLKVLGGESLGYMLLGMALMKSGLFTGGWDRARIRRMMIWGYAISLPAIALFTWWAFASGFDPVVLLGTFLAWSIPFRVLSTLAHVALAVLLIERFAGSAIVARIAATGRMAFTNYLATSVVMTTIFYGYGLGLYGHVGRAEVYLFVFAMWALMLAWSKPWLNRFAYGPLEWLWRSMARGRLQPMRRNIGLAS